MYHLAVIYRVILYIYARIHLNGGKINCAWPLGVALLVAIEDIRILARCSNTSFQQRIHLICHMHHHNWPIDVDPAVSFTELHY